VGFSSEAPPNIPKRGQKRSTSSLVGPDGFAAATECGYELTPDSLRDSGISMSENSNLNNLNNTCYEDFDLKSHQQEMNISSSPFEESPKMENPPPIPPKSSLACSSSLNSSLELTGSLERKREAAPAEGSTPDDDAAPPRRRRVPLNGVWSFRCCDSYLNMFRVSRRLPRSGRFRESSVLERST
jgi:hypothetical protein